MPLKIAGSEMITMDALTVAMSMPSVVLDSTDHLYGTRPLDLGPGEPGTVEDMSLPR